MEELELARSTGDRRLYAFGDIGTVRLKGWAARAARAEANGRAWDIALRGLWGREVEATDETGTTVGRFKARGMRRGGTLRWVDREFTLRPGEPLARALPSPTLGCCSGGLAPWPAGTDRAGHHE